MKATTNNSNIQNKHKIYCWFITQIMVINHLLVLLLLYIEQLVIMNGINHLFVIIKLFYINIDIL